MKFHNCPLIPTRFVRFICPRNARPIQTSECCSSHTEEKNCIIRLWFSFIFFFLIIFFGPKSFYDCICKWWQQNEYIVMVFWKNSIAWYGLVGFYGLDFITETVTLYIYRVLDDWIIYDQEWMIVNEWRMVHEWLLFCTRKIDWMSEWWLFYVPIPEVNCLHWYIKLERICHLHFRSQNGFKTLTHDLVKPFPIKEA